MFDSKKDFIASFQDTVSRKYGKALADTNDLEKYNALAAMVTAKANSLRRATNERFKKADCRRVYYFSLEFLIGRLLYNYLQNLGVLEIVQEGLKEIGTDLNNLVKQELDPGLGNGGLGRLAACFLDSMASEDVPGYGYGLFYRHGLFKQEIENGYQIEKPDDWLVNGYPWAVSNPEKAIKVKFGGKVLWHGKDGNYTYEWVPEEEVLAVPNEIPVIGYTANTVNRLSLFSARQIVEELDLVAFNQGDYSNAFRKRAQIDAITQVLYPSDSHRAGQILRLKQEYFLVSAGIADIVRHYRNDHGDDAWDAFASRVAIHINDTHPALCGPELMRVFLDEVGLQWDKAWEIVTNTISYTNHTILPEALEQWPIDMLREVLPRVYMIVEEIDRRYKENFPKNLDSWYDLMAKTSILWDGKAKMANLSVITNRANATFADSGNNLEYIGNTKDGRRCYQSGFGSEVSAEDRIKVFKERIATIFNLGAVELKTDVKKIRIRGDKFTAKKNLHGDFMGQDSELEAKINALYDLADILATSKYDPSATAKEPSYANPALQPKNKAHKGVKYWYKFRNEIVFDGVPYTVTFDIRDKGGEQYQYLIDFKENKTPGLSNTAVKSLLPADQVSYEDNIAQVPKSVNPKYSLSDNTYLDAVNRGDTETAQKMVDEAAKSAGFTRKLYHGTASNFNVFGFGRTGIFTTDNFDMAKTYGNRVISLYGKEGANVLTIDAQESPHYAIKVSKDVLDFSEYPLIGSKETYSTNDISLIAFREGYDVVVIENVYDNYSIASDNKENGLGTDVVYKDPNQVKSSEPVTYDDDGNVIPLSQRFNKANDDIRYSLSDSDGKTLSREQQNFFKDSKARDENGNLLVMYHGSQSLVTQ